jgi:hypothetical protein
LREHEVLSILAQRGRRCIGEGLGWLRYAFSTIEEAKLHAIMRCSFVSRCHLTSLQHIVDSCQRNHSSLSLIPRQLLTKPVLPEKEMNAEMHSDKDVSMIMKQWKEHGTFLMLWATLACQFRKERKLNAISMHGEAVNREPTPSSHKLDKSAQNGVMA